MYLGSRRSINSNHDDNDDGGGGGGGGGDDDDGDNNSNVCSGAVGIGCQPSGAYCRFAAL